MKKDLLVFAVWNLISALQPPHCLPHVLGLQWWCVSPLFANIQCCKNKDLSSITRIILFVYFLIVLMIFFFFLLLLTFLNNFTSKNLGDTRHGNYHILGHWWSCYGLDQLQMFWEMTINIAAVEIFFLFFYFLIFFKVFFYYNTDSFNGSLWEGRTSVHLITIQLFLGKWWH